MVKFNELKAIVKVRGGGQYARKYGTSLALDNILNDCFAGDFKKEDLAAAWLLHQCTSVSSSMYTVAKQARLGYIFVGGSFPNREIVRTLITKQFIKARLNMEKREENTEVST